MVPQDLLGLGPPAALERPAWVTEGEVVQRAAPLQRGRKTVHKAPLLKWKAQADFPREHVYPKDILGQQHRKTLIH